MSAGAHPTEMEQLHGVLSKMIKERQGDQITPELWQHCEESARLYAFVERMLHGSVFVCVQAMLTPFPCRHSHSRTCWCVVVVLQVPAPWRRRSTRTANRQLAQLFCGPQASLLVQRE
jgi:hypothetical protein